MPPNWILPTPLVTTATRYERKKLLEAHYAGATPLDMMKIEMDRLTRELHQAEQLKAAAKLSLTDLDQQLERGSGRSPPTSPGSTS